MLASEQEPESASSDFTFNKVEALVGRLFVHAQGDGNMTRLAEGSVLSRVVPLTEVIYAIARMIYP